MKQRKRFPFSVENTIVIFILLTSLCLMTLGCSVEDTCYDCTEIEFNEVLNEWDCKVIEC